ncbi:CD1375 family protein [Clostridium sp. HBUAS56017]|nr:CD1375 family protein [Clostridium sp. HBUAS56017]
MVQVYADLVELGLRALEKNDNGIILVPVLLKEKVKEEIEKRKFSNK